MIRTFFNKLVRDKIPSLVIEDGLIPEYKVLTPEAYHDELCWKLIEETMEFKGNPCIEEMADLLEVFYTLCEHHYYSLSEVESIRLDKIKKKGSFLRGRFLKYIDHPESIATT